MEETNQQKPPIPVGISGKPDTYPNINWNQFFALKQSVSQLFDFLTAIEQQGLEAGTLRYFFETDLVEKEAKDKEGNIVKNEKGEVVKYRDLKDDFWTPKIITPDQFTITPEKV